MAPKKKSVKKKNAKIETAAHQPVTEQAADDSGAKRGAGLGLCNHDCVGHTCACMQLSARYLQDPPFDCRFVRRQSFGTAFLNGDNPI